MGGISRHRHVYWLNCISHRKFTEKFLGNTTEIEPPVPVIEFLSFQQLVIAGFHEVVE